MSLPITSVKPKTLWTERAQKAVIDLKPGDIKLVGNVQTDIPFFRLRTPVLDRALESIEGAYFTGFGNVAEALKQFGIEVYKAARALQFFVSENIGEELYEKDSSVFPMIEDCGLKTSAFTLRKGSNSPIHYDAEGSADIFSIGYPPPCSGKLSFYHLAGSGLLITEGDRESHLKHYNDHSEEFESFTPPRQELEDHHFYIMIDGNHYLLHGASEVTEPKRKINIVNITRTPITPNEYIVREANLSGFVNKH